MLAVTKTGSPKLAAPRNYQIQGAVGILQSDKHELGRYAGLCLLLKNWLGAFQAHLGL